MGSVLGAAAVGDPCDRLLDPRRLGLAKRGDERVDIVESAVRAVDRTLDLTGRRDHHRDRHARGLRELQVQRLRRLRDRHEEACPYDHHHRVTAVSLRAMVSGSLADGVGVRRLLREVDDREVHLLRERLRELTPVERVELDEQLTEALAGRGLLEQRLGDLRRRHLRARDEDVAESRPATGRPARPDGGSDSAASCAAAAGQRSRGGRWQACHGGLAIDASLSGARMGQMSENRPTDDDGRRCPVQRR